MSTIGLLGTGRIGSAVARLAVNAGHDVVLSNSRAPETLAELVKELGAHASAATQAEAVEAGDIVVVAVPFKAYREMPAGVLHGKVTIDASNYYAETDGPIPELDEGRSTNSEVVQELLSGASVVKTLGVLYFENLLTLASPVGAEDRTALPVASDDDGAKAAVIEFLDSIGYDALDAGPLAEGWRFEQYTPVTRVYVDEESGKARAVKAVELAASLAAAVRRAPN